MLEKIVLCLVMAGLLVLLFHQIRRHPGAFSAANLGKSLTVLGVLALILIGFITLLVLFASGTI